MSQTAITLAFEQWKASQAVTGEPVLLDEFVFANVPGLDATKPVDRSETLPPAAQIVHRQAVSRKGVVNENAVVHSVVLGAEVGDFSFNWIGLINKASNTLAMIVHAPLQQKLKTKDGQQGNVLTRSFLMEYNGAQAETGINTPAETWQIDFTARMAGMDERQRLENIDLYGAAAFLGDGWLVAKSGSQFYVTAGAGYVRGLRAQLAAKQNITVTTKPVKVWLDVAWAGTLTSAWGVVSKITVAANLADYVQSGVQHYVFAVASIDANGNITDLRPKGTLNDQAASDALAKHEQSRNHPDGTLNAKGFVQLSSSVASDSEAFASTSKAVKAAYDLAKGKYTAQDATTSQKGIVQLSSATDSTSESVAATPKAVKLVLDLANGKYTAQDATTTRKGIVQLSNATNSTSEVLAATPKAVSAAVKEIKETLGTASGANVVTSMTDTTAGRVPVVGWMGLGVGNSGSGCPVSGGIDYVSEPTGIWQTTNENTTGTFPSNVSHYGTLYRMRGSANDVSQLYFPGASVANGGNIYYRQYNAVSMTWGGWYKIYSEFSKPTASDVDAVSASQGGTFQRAVTFNQGLMSRGKIAWGDYANAVGSSAYNAMVNVSDSTGKTRWAFGPYVNSWSVYAYNSDGSYKGNVVSIDFTTFNAAFSAQVVPGNYANFDARYQPKGSYIPAGQAYTKAESDARYQLKNAASRGTSGWFKDTSTGMIFQWGTITLPASGYRTTSAAFSFPITFPNVALNIQTTPASAGVSNNGYLAVTACTSLSASGGTIYADSNNGESFSKTQTVRYFAVGY
ncbi:tail fiber protein [Enterobacter cloacae]